LDFQKSSKQTDERSRAYREAMRGEVPTSVSTSSHTHVAFRLLLIRFVDLISSLDNFTPTDKGKGRAVELVSGLKVIVSKVSLS